MREVLPIAAIVAILIAVAAVSGGAKLPDRAPVDLAPGAPAGAERYELPVAVKPGPEATLPSFEVDPFDRYGVTAPPHPWEALADPSLEEGALVSLVAAPLDAK